MKRNIHPAVFAVPDLPWKSAGDPPPKETGDPPPEKIDVSLYVIEMRRPPMRGWFAVNEPPYFSVFSAEGRLDTVMAEDVDRMARGFPAYEYRIREYLPGKVVRWWVASST